MLYERVNVCVHKELQIFIEAFWRKNIIYICSIGNTEPSIKTVESALDAGMSEPLGNVFVYHNLSIVCR